MDNQSMVLPDKVPNLRTAKENKAIVPHFAANLLLIPKKCD
ncbi:hypothetical protein [Turicimonas muris]|nr:hypothetical protein [Turicimonas muris]